MYVSTFVDKVQWDSQSGKRKRNGRIPRHALDRTSANGMSRRVVDVRAAPAK
jgi:hypothetical protein